MQDLADITATAKKSLIPRLTVYPSYIEDRDQWIDSGLIGAVLRHADSDGYARDDSRPEEWAVGAEVTPPWRLQRAAASNHEVFDARLSRILGRSRSGKRLTLADVEVLFRVRGSSVAAVCHAADQLRREVTGDVVTYVVNRNINYTNICLYKCSFCAFSKGKTSENLRGAPYVVDLEEIERRTAEAWSRGATEVCLQGGIHPAFTGQTYIDICRAAKRAAPDIHVHAFSPLEITHGARTFGVSVEHFLAQLQDVGLGTLPGTAAEILDDDIRRIICPDKITAGEWLSTIAAAHGLGLHTTSTIMFGHLEKIQHWARHLLAIRDLQERTGGITEFVPLPYVHMEAPMHRKGLSRPGPTYRETMLMHAVARLVLHPLIRNIQVSWVKLGEAGAADCLHAGANDLGGTLMNESISRAAGASHGQEMAPDAMDRLIRSIGRHPRQRNTLYGETPTDRVSASHSAAALMPVHNLSARNFRQSDGSLQAQ